MTSADALWAYADDLQRYAAHMCRHSHDAEDVAQTTLLKAALKIDGFRGEASVRTWLHTIATNECRMLRRKARLEPFDETIEPVLTDGRSGLTPSEAPDPESLAIEAENRRQVVHALDRLPERYRQVLILRDGCGLGSADVARVLDSTVPAVKSRLYRARRLLRRDLAELRVSS
jgi:RNA polymerase sigma-70 factor (ECF subfamily)